MAVKPEVIKARLKVLFPKANLSTKRLDELSARLATKPADDADETAIDGVINSANDFYSFEEIAREDDIKRTLEQKAKPEPTPADPTPQPTPTPEPDNTPEWAKALLANNAKLTADIEAIKTGRVTETKLQQARKLFDDSEIFKSVKDDKTKNFFFKQVDVNSEISTEDQIKELAETYSNLVQHNADNENHGGTPPVSTNNSKPSEAEMDEIIGSATR